MNTPLQSKQSGFLRLDLDTKAADGTFEGYGSVFGVVDHGGDMVLPGAFALSLADHRKNGTFPLMLWQHKQDTPIGRWVAMEEDRIGLRVKGKLNLGTTAGADAFAHIKEGDVSGLSIGYRLPPNGVEILPSGIQQIKTASLFEVSVVSLPMNDAARIQLGSKADLERLLAKSGLAREAARRVAFGGWPALTQTPSSDLSPLLQALQASADRF